MILTRKNLREAQTSAVGGAVLIGAAFLFRGSIEVYIGATATSWILYVFLFFYLISLIRLAVGWSDIRNWERTERKLKEDGERESAEWEAKREKERANYDAFLEWVRQNPKTVDRLLSTVEFEQIDNPEHRSWLSEGREKEGLNPSDLSRLYDWLKARQGLKQASIEPPLLPL